MEFLKRIGEKMNKLLIEEWELQGHKMDQSKFESELEYETYQDGTSMGVIGRSVYYAGIINRGVPSERIPYKRGSGAKTSKYIDGLIDYVLRRMGIAGAQGVSIAFAIANKHKKYGMPSLTDYKGRQLSQTGKRTEFIEEAFKRGETEIDEIVGSELDGYIKRLIT